MAEWKRWVVAAAMVLAASSIAAASPLQQMVAPGGDAAGLNDRACAPPAAADDDLPVARPEAAGFEAAALCATLRQIAQAGDNIHSVLVLRGGRLVGELYRSGPDATTLYSLFRTTTTQEPTSRHDMRSVSKSIVSLLYGALLAQGRVPPPTTPVVSLYPEYPQIDTPRRRAIRVEHLLSMSTGLEWEEPSPLQVARHDDQLPLLWTGSVYQCVFGRDVVAEPGTRFVYSGGNTAVLADIMVRATGTSLRELVQQTLFQPLGITDWEWTGSLRGDPVAFAGLRLRSRDLMKIGAMMLAGGAVQGRQIVPKAWIASITAPHIDNGAGGYGYQFWTSTLDWNGKALTIATALGNGGQTLVLIPALDIAIVTTAGDYNDPRIFPIVKAIPERIVAAIRR